MKTNRGIIAVNKRKDWTSFDVVNKIKHKIKPLKVGHLGTLDPMATGVLLVTVGKATKLFDIMQEKTKRYEATFEFGYETNTLDSTGEVVLRSEICPTLDEIYNILPQFMGKIEQIPPKFSAKNINGQRAYDLARKNIDFDISPKTVYINDIKIISFEGKILKLDIECGSGTYIRSIGRDIAHKVSSLATMTALVRTKIDEIDIANCIDIDEIEQVHNQIIPIKNILKYPFLNLSLIDQQKLLNGQIIDINENDGLYQIQDDHDTIALVKIKNFKAKMSLFLG